MPIAATVVAGFPGGVIQYPLQCFGDGDIQLAQYCGNGGLCPIPQLTVIHHGETGRRQATALLTELLIDLCQTHLKLMRDKIRCRRRAKENQAVANGAELGAQRATWFTQTDQKTRVIKIFCERWQPRTEGGIFRQ